ncbi:hypothetical protein ACFQDD_01985 [Halorubrum pallidum]|uniref:Histidine kinase n=1 Tax=Halorubrum pallidum TaxID=1526114 RepID=A0ABD5T4N2_9EURY
MADLLTIAGGYGVVLSFLTALVIVNPRNEPVFHAGIGLMGGSILPVYYTSIRPAVSVTRFGDAVAVALSVMFVASAAVQYHRAPRCETPA